MRQQGYAVVDTHSGEVKLNTVHDTERGAKVNGLVTMMNIFVSRLWTDTMIDNIWSEANPVGGRYAIGAVTVVWVEEE